MNFQQRGERAYAIALLRFAPAGVAAETVRLANLFDALVDEGLAERIPSTFAPGLVPTWRITERGRS